ncbi:hypothetical protein BT96DRAFT_1073246 [Gymnopus androsaceus JB14]|uniref:Uncharacterized protein n=1 Tax=Gymnopus androsaceus JB14 TaxID=1447944 RepID=A0A6A4GS32_9AGAR|nr:hypothetical protein BT96DRAFT_1073246 [Gymnopus androsaceus JB14]
MKSKQVSDLQPSSSRGIWKFKGIEELRQLKQLQSWLGSNSDRQTDRQTAIAPKRILHPASRLRPVDSIPFVAKKEVYFAFRFKSSEEVGGSRMLEDRKKAGRIGIWFTKCTALHHTSYIQSSDFGFGFAFGSEYQSWEIQIYTTYYIPYTYGQQLKIIRQVLGRLKTGVGHGDEESSYQENEDMEQGVGIQLALPPPTPASAASGSRLNFHGAASSSMGITSVIPGQKQPGQTHMNAKRAEQRKVAAEKAEPGPSSQAYAYVLSHGTAIKVNADATEFPTAKGGVTGNRGAVDELGEAIKCQKLYTVVELHCLGRKHFKMLYSIIDQIGRIVAICAGQSERTYAKDLVKAHDAMKAEAANLN